VTLQIQSPEKQKNTTLNPLGILMLLWLDSGLSTVTETHTQQYKGDFRVFVARKDHSFPCDDNDPAHKAIVA
jgi:hypothetical protein